MFTVYVLNGKDWVYEDNYPNATKASIAARHYHDQGYQVAIDSSEVPEQLDHID